VVLSRKVSVLLVALVVALGIGLSGAVGSASPKDNDDKGRSTLTVLTKNREIKVVELGPQGPSHGDLRVINAPLFDQSGKEKVGRLDVFCAITDPGQKAHMAQCTGTFSLQDGEISVQGVVPVPNASNPAAGNVDAITGGTGKYAGVRGEHRFRTPGTKGIHTFHFID
jgi:allene oxide cyclase-like protein